MTAATNKRHLRQLRILLAGMALVLQCACGGQLEVRESIQSPRLDPVDITPLLAMNFPPLPSGKTISEPTNTEVLGSNEYDKSTNANEVDSTMQLSSGEGTASWAIWELALASNIPDKVEVQISTPAGDFAWIALSDYSSNTWEIKGPVSEITVLKLDREINLSAANNCYIAVLTVNGSVATVEKLVLTYYVSGWQIVTVDSEGYVGYYCCLAEVDGNPAISYYAEDIDGYGDLKYARSTTALGGSSADWSQFVLIDTEGDVGYDSSLTVVDGNPAISYQDETNEVLKYARATTSTGAEIADWSQIVVVDDSGDVGYDSSLAVVDGNPAISYYESIDANVGHLKYARSTSSSGAQESDWSQIVTVDDDGRVGWLSSLAVVDGNPAIGYYDILNQWLKYARATTATGADAADWSQIVVVDADGRVGRYCSLAVVDGNPAISYYDSDDDDLMYIRSTTSTGSDAGHWAQKVTVFATGDVGENTSLAIIDGNPAIAFFDFGLQNLKYFRSATSTGEDAAAWPGLPTTVDTGDGVGVDISMAAINGRPAIAYQDGGNHDLKFAVFLE